MDTTRSFYAQGLWWHFYNYTADNANYLPSYATSSDGVTWSAPVTITGLSAGYNIPSVAYNNRYFYMAVWHYFDAVKYNVAQPNSNGTLTFLGSWQTVYSSPDGGNYIQVNENPLICLDKQSRPWNNCTA